MRCLSSVNDSCCWFLRTSLQHVMSADVYSH